ncbi:hypothetical protein MJO28_006324 [Puccinia striiformis f. sp. tritici]|uniref:Uncharacterized protein n=1 Tax=Puccinia striiformis f. sp. tritici TaxID=168172 RepID=A0ACC0EGL1_9BASI|nr:hypothetical protein MJO28_006324 [Puccinia striiformis f. sp. tritici]
MALREKGLESYIDNPPLPNPTKKMKKRTYKTINILCSNLTDGVFKTIVKKEIEQSSYELWQMFKSVYASDSILAGYEVWALWEDTQFNDDMAAYIAGIEHCMAKFDSLGMIVPDFIICCSIISRITKKRPFLMQSLFGDLNSLGKPKMVIEKLREYGRYEKTVKVKTNDQPAVNPTTTALSTSSSRPVKRKKRPFNPIQCIGGHNPKATNHDEAHCWTLHPERRESDLAAKKAKTSSFITTADDNHEPDTLDSQMTALDEETEFQDIINILRVDKGSSEQESADGMDNRAALLAP